MRAVLSIGGYAANTAAVFAVGVLSVPAIIHFAGTSAWAGVAVTQAVAGIAAVPVAFGWNAMGPSIVATMHPEDRAHYYFRTLVARGLLFLLVAPFAIWTSVLLSGIDALAASLSTLAYLTQSLGASWYFVGEGRPFRLLFLDTAPRLVGVLAGIVALAAGLGLTAFTALLLVGSLASVCLGVVAVLRGTHLRRDQMLKPRVGVLLMSQKHAVSTTSSAALYANAPLIAVSIIAPRALETFAIMFKLFNYAAAALAPAVQFLQSWVPARGADCVPSRSKKATMISAAGGLAATSAMLVFGAPACHLLAAGRLDVGMELVVPFAIAIGAVNVSQVVGLACLTALGCQNIVSASTALGAVVGIVSLVCATWWAQGVGAAWAIAGTEVLVMSYQLMFIRRYWPRTTAAASIPQEEY